MMIYWVQSQGIPSLKCIGAISDSSMFERMFIAAADLT